MACLRVYLNDLLRGVYTLFDRKTVLGRDRDCALVLRDLDVARRHAVIHKEGRRHVLSSISSKGVRVQADVIASPVVLNDGEMVQIGPYTLVYETSSAEASGSQQNKEAEGNDPAFVLWIIEGEKQKKSFPLGRASVRIGRGGDNDIVLSDSTVSNRHAVLERQSEEFLLRDLKSTNGTRVDGRRIDAVVVSAGVKIEIGKTTLQLQQWSGAPGRSTLVGQSAPARQMRAAAETAGDGTFSVRIEAEVGCEVRAMAEEIHRCSPTPKSPFVVVDCDGLSEIEATRELFGMPAPKGAAEDSDPKGVFNRFQKGSVFLERVDCLGESVRSALWQRLRERTATSSRIGESRATDVRVIVSFPPGGCVVPTDVDFYPVAIPPLRERTDDLPLFIEQLGLEVASAALEKLKRHVWPGNVHEFQNTLERAAIIAPQKVIQPEDLIFLPKDPGAMV